MFFNINRLEDVVPSKRLGGSGGIIKGLKPRPI